VEVVRVFLDRELAGFGELFRSLSHARIGSAAMLSRALGGIAAGKPVFCLPGSRAAVTLGMQELIVPELGHLVQELRK
jgi:molybdenum cofactor biosynthesis protein B